jgi:hypothetical protein
LKITNNGASGLTLTDGTAITLSLDGSGRVIGMVGTDSVNPGLTGETAFAIAIDPLTGKTYVAQYLSLHQDSSNSTPNDPVSLAAGSVGVTVTLTDGDGDKATSTATDISSHVSFLDDGPTIGAIQNAVIPAVSGSDVQGTWQPVFGADGPQNVPTGDPNPLDPAFAAIGIAMGTAPPGETYVVTNTGQHTPNGEAVFSVQVTNSSSNTATFFEYTHYDPSTHTAEMFAYGDLTDAVAGSTSTTNQFFTLSMAANGTYDFHLTSTTALESVITTSFTSGGNSGTGTYAELAGGGVTYVKNASSIPPTPPTGFDAIIDGWNTACR